MQSCLSNSILGLIVWTGVRGDRGQTVKDGVRRVSALLLGLGVLSLRLPATAEIVSAAPDHYKLRHEATSSLAPDKLWERLIQPETWWADAHTYSGSARHLSLQDFAGGYWREDWDQNGVIHGTVLTVLDGEMLRLDAPFGPLQGMGVTVVWTITLEATDDGGTKVVFDEVANGSSESALDQIAPAVDFVKQEAITRLTGEPGPMVPPD